MTDTARFNLGIICEECGASGAAADDIIHEQGCSNGGISTARYSFTCSQCNGHGDTQGTIEHKDDCPYKR